MKKVANLKKLYSPWAEGIYLMIVIESKEVISGQLVKIFRKSVDSGEVPTLLRQANIVTIFKKGHQSLMSNYRSVSVK